MNTRCRIAPILILCILSASIGMAGQKGNGKKKHGYSDDRAMGAGARIGVDVFLGRDRSLIRNHYLCDAGTLPPGLAKRHGSLPPGLEKQLRRRGHLPPGLEKRFYPFPVALEQRLPPLRPGLTRGTVGVHAVIMDRKTSLILDVFSLM